MFFVFFSIAFIASLIGAVSGLGGGIIIKPVLDMAGIAGVAEASFMSGLTVLAMTSVNIFKAIRKPKDMLIDKTRSPWLALGAVFGGLIGNQIFDGVMTFVGAENARIVGAIQAVALLLITLSVMLYMLNRDKIETKNSKSFFLAVLIGLGLGVISSFLGIGGGPMNLVILYFFFSMSTKQAAQNSLFIIFFSQISSLIQTFVTNSVPRFNSTNLIFMIIGGVSAGLIGSILLKKLSTKTVDRLLMLVFALVAIINIYNIIKFLA